MKIFGFLTGILSCLCPCVNDSNTTAQKSNSTVMQQEEQISELCKIEIGDQVFPKRNEFTSSGDNSVRVLTIGETLGYSYCKNLNTVFVYKDGENYIITLSELDCDYIDLRVSKLLVFSPEKRVLLAKNIDLIDDNDLKSFKGKTFKEVREKYGEPHCNISDGYYIPSYITKQGAIVCLEVISFNDNDDNIVKNFFYRNVLD